MEHATKAYAPRLQLLSGDSISLAKEKKRTQEGAQYLVVIVLVPFSPSPLLRKLDNHGLDNSDASL